MIAIYQRELSILTRRPVLWIGPTVLLLLLVFLTVSAWPLGLSLSPDEMTIRARSIWTQSTWALLGFVALLSPVLAAPSLSSERTGRTLSLVMMSGVSPITFALAKLFAHCTLVSLVVLLPLPILMAVSSLGAMDMTDVALVCAVLMSVGVFGAGLGLFFSAIFDGIQRSLTVAYAILALTMISPILLNVLGVTTATTTSNFGIEHLFFAPTVNIYYVLEGFPLGSSLSRPVHFVQPAIFLFLALFLTVATAPFTKLAASGRWQAAGSNAGSDWLLAFKPIKSLFIGLSNNPIFWRETSVHSASRFQSTQRFGLVLCAVATGLGLLHVYKPVQDRLTAAASLLPGTESNAEKLFGVIVGILCFLVCAATTVAATAAISKERESGLLSHLAVTPLRFHTFIWGKILGGLFNTVLVIAAPVIYGSILTVLHGQSILTPFFLLIGIPIIAAFSITQGIYCGLASLQPTRALIAAVIVVVCQQFLCIVCTISFSPLFLGYQTVVAFGSQRDGSEILFFAIATIFSFVIHLVTLRFLSKRLDRSFDKFLGRIGDLELNLGRAN